VSRLAAAACGAFAVAALASSAAPAAAAVPSGRALSAACPDEDLAPTADNLPRIEKATLCLINRQRADAGLLPLARSTQLDRSAAFHSAEMVRHHFLGHEAAGRPTLLARIRGFGYFNGVRNGMYAENVGAGPDSNGTARALMDAWMASPPHRTNILYPTFRDVGISAVPAPPDRAFFADFASTVYTTDFGRRYIKTRCVASRRVAPPRTPPGPASPRRRFCRTR
jgi:uncharacterized protein YkwD